MNKPKIRFKGFEDEWKQVLIADKCNFTRGQGYSKSDLKESGHPIFLYGRLYTKYSTFINSVDTYADLQPFAVLSTGKEIVMPSSGEEAEGISVASAVLSKGIILGGGLNIVLPNQKEIHNPFLALNLTFGSPHKELAKRAQGKSVVHLYNQDISSVTICYPQVEEQISIAEYFKQIDQLITEAEREVSRLEKMKQASLQKMFPRPGATTPEVRFDGFTGDWSMGKLSDLLEIDDNRNSKNEFGREDVLSVSGEFGLVNQIEFQGRSFAGASLHNYKVTHLGHVVYTKSPLKAQPFGIVKSNQYGEGILSPLYAVYKTINNSCADFIHYYFEPVARLNNYLRPLINKGAKNTILISDETALQGEIIYPTDTKEQFYIAYYFINLDSLLSAKRQKLVKLRNIKQACLDKMFVNTTEL